jgi:hypothetical protein
MTDISAHTTITSSGSGGGGGGVVVVAVAVPSIYILLPKSGNSWTKFQSKIIHLGVRWAVAEWFRTYTSWLK